VSAVAHLSFSLPCVDKMMVVILVVVLSNPVMQTIISHENDIRK